MVFPALAGVILLAEITPLLEIGFSRTRGGDPGTHVEINGSTVVFPALAGVILLLLRLQKMGNGFSRTRGGDPPRARAEGKRVPFFPHSRG